MVLLGVLGRSTFDLQQHPMAELEEQAIVSLSTLFHPVLL